MSGITYDIILRRLRQFDGVSAPGGGNGILVDRLVFKEQFTGDGSTTTFQLSGAILNGSFSGGSWIVSNVKYLLPANITGINSKPIYDSIIPITRNKINIVSINGSGLVTLDYTPRNGEVFWVWYWYQLGTDDYVIDYYRDDFTASMEIDSATDIADFQAAVDTNSNVIDSFKKSVDTTDVILQGTINKFVSANEKSALLGTTGTPNGSNRFVTDSDPRLNPQITTINSLSSVNQFLATGTAGTDFGIVSLGSTHTFNLPVASAINTGKLSNTDWTTFNNKQDALGFTAVPNTRTITINGVSFDLSANRSWSVGTVTSVDISGSDFVITGNPIATSGTINLALATVNSNIGTFNNVTVNAKGLVTAASNVSYQAPISLTTTGNSGSSTFLSNVLNVPTYTLAGLGGQPLSTNLTSLSGLSYSSLSFVKMSAAGTFTLDTNTYLTGNQNISLSGEATGSGTTSIVVTLTNSAVIGKVLTGYTSGAGVVSATDTILQAIQKLNGNIGALVTGVSSVFGRTGAVTAQSGDYTTTLVTEGANLYFTNGRVDTRVQSYTGDVTLGGTAFSITTNAVTLSKFQQIATNSLLGRSTAGTGNVEVITVGSGLSLSGGTLTVTGSSGGVLGIANGGTNSSAALNNNRVMISSGGAIVEAGALNGNMFIVTSASGTPVNSALSQNVAGTQLQIGYQAVYNTASGTTWYLSANGVGSQTRINFSGVIAGTSLWFNTKSSFQITADDGLTVWNTFDTANKRLLVGGTGSPHSSFQIDGSFATKYISKAVSYSLTATDFLVDITGGSNTQTLPTAVSATGRLFALKNSGTGTGTVDATSSQTIDGVTKQFLFKNDSFLAESDGTNYKIIADGRKTRIFSQTADATIGNSTTETSILGTGDGTKTLPADYFNYAGKSLVFRISGYASRTSGNTTLRFKIGGTTVISVTFSVNATNNAWEIDLMLTCRTTGVTGTIMVNGFATYNTTVLSAFVNTTTSTIDTTASQTLDFTAQHGTANAGNTITSTNALILQYN